MRASNVHSSLLSIARTTPLMALSSKWSRSRANSDSGSCQAHSAHRCGSKIRSAGSASWLPRTASCNYAQAYFCVIALVTVRVWIMWLLDTRVSIFFWLRTSEFLKNPRIKGFLVYFTLTARLGRAGRPGSAGADTRFEESDFSAPVRCSPSLWFECSSAFLPRDPHVSTIRLLALGLIPTASHCPPAIAQSEISNLDFASSLFVFWSSSNS